MREKLIELLRDADLGCIKTHCHSCGHYDSPNKPNGIPGCVECRIADHLLANGVTAQDNTEISEELLTQLRNTPVTILQEEPTIEVVQEWISVKDRLPEESGEYLAYCGEYDGICVLYFEILETKSKWRTNWKEVTHWQYLPQPPKGE